ncbi:HlyD family efflux transporter periplasmic adaptor subunit [Chitinophaga flava]|uniref:HlyD family secretion protein n=1 Tax=Chitinophaga flava TaxID=2259036 RepID=A0A365XXP4_9BACT|nr:HlyD family efflux transporter periplasmic adaptor subunit [Chitinophaga flava]RBL91136.1 hypothetical protein DF182_00500 [Chitinophaga flava]
MSAEIPQKADQLRWLEDDIPYSDEANEILGRTPGWIVRYGITTICVIITLLLIGCYFIKYPEIVNAGVTIYSASPPVKIVAKTPGNLQHLLVSGDSAASENQVIAIIANPARFEDVETVAGFCKYLDTSRHLLEPLAVLNLHEGYQLGELQDMYVGLLQAVEQCRYFLQKNGYPQKLANLRHQRDYQENLLVELRKRSELLREQLQLQYARFGSDSSLLIDKVIAPAQYDEARMKYLNQRMATEACYSDILRSNAKVEELEQQIFDLNKSFEKEQISVIRDVQMAARKLLGSYGSWKEKFVLVSPIKGKVVYYNFWKENQFVHAGEGIFMVVPETQQLVVRGGIGISGAGRVKVGQEVLIKLAAYPYEEYGTLSGKIVSRSEVPMDSTFSLEIKLIHDSLQTSLHKVIPLQAQMDGSGEIFTENKNILQRLFEKVYKSTR